MFTILIADDHELIRCGLRNALEKTGVVRIAGEASNGRELLNLLEKHGSEVDIVLLDIRMPDMDGFDFLELIQDKQYEFKTVILSTFSSKEYISQAFRKGAAGYLTKDASRDELLHALHEVAAGRQYLSPALSRDLSEIIKGGMENGTTWGLSPREYEIAALLVKGEPVKAISARLDLAATTVSTYKKRIFEKIGVDSDAELALFAYKNGLIPTDQEHRG